MIKRTLMLAALLLAGCSAGDDTEAPADPVALVKLGRAQQGAVTREVTLFGIAEGGAGAKQALSAPADAIVARIVAPVGTAVARGAVIIELAPAPTTRLDLAKAAADARAADAALARALRLRADGLVSDAEVEAARAAAASAIATRASLSGRRASLILRASAPGYVESISVNPGDQISAGAAVATLTRPGDVRAHFGIDPALADQLRAGSPLRIAGDGSHAPLTVPIESINPLVDPQTRLASVFAHIPPGAAIASGQPLQATVALGSADAALTIPYAALLDDGGQPFVYVVTGGVAHRRDVETGPTTGDRIAIVKGVAPGDVVVTEGGTALEDGMKVRTH